MSKEKQIEGMACTNCIHQFICFVNNDRVPTPCSEYENKSSYRKQEWISVENPPETYRDKYGELIPFLVCCKGTVYPFRAMYDGTNWGDGIGVLKISHWMPLPEPPKGE